MLSASAPTPPPPAPPPLRTDTGVVELDEQWKADLRKSIEHDLRHMVEDAQIVRDTILGSQPSERSREGAQRDFEESMNNIRMLAQEEFTRRSRQEMSERQWALDVVVSNSPDVARQQQWILDNIRKADEEHILSPSTDAPQDAEGVFSASPQQQSDSEQGPDESSEEGYGTGGREDEEGESEELEESADEEGEDEDEDEEDEDGGEVNHKPRQSRPPSRPNVPMTQPLHSRSPVSRRNAPSHQRPRLNSQLAEDNDGNDADDPHRHSSWRHETQASQPYSPGGAPRRQSSGSQTSVWRPFPRAPEPSGISRTFAHANGQGYNTGPVQYARRSSVNSTGSNSSGAGLHRAGFINSDHYRNSSVAPHGSSERPPTQSRDRIASNTSIPPRERQTSASASPPTFPTPPRAIPGARPSLEEAVRLPTSASPGSRAIYAMQRSPEDMRQGMPIPRGPPTPEEGPRGISWGSLNSRRSIGDFSVHRRHNSKGEQRLAPVDGDISDGSDDVVGHLEDRQSIRSTRSVRSTTSIEQLTAWWEAEARRKEEEARRLEKKARRSLEEARHLQACAQQADASAKVRETAAQSRKVEVRHKEAEAKKRDAEAQRKEEDAQRRELEAQRKEARKKEDEQARIVAKIAGMGDSHVGIVSNQPSIGPVSTPSPPPIPVRPEEEVTPGSARRDIVSTAVPSQMTSEDLLALWGRVGVHVARAATLLLERSKHKLVGNGSYEGFIAETLAQVPNALHPQSRGEYGILIYAQTAVQVHTCVTDILPGDVIVLNAAKLKGHDGLRLYSNSAGEGAPCIGVVSEFEVRKLKLRALQANQQVGRGTQAVESVSYRLGDLKSGTIKVYRVREA